jgi:hypothetical protein
MRVKDCAIVAAVMLAAACDSTGTSTTGISGFGGSGAATHLVFAVQPGNTVAGATITPAVQLRAATTAGAVDTTFVNSVTVAIGANPGGATLTGTATVPAVAGVATFSNLRINNAGTAYTLTASAPTLTSATSTAFNITAGTPVGPR